MKSVTDLMETTAIFLKGEKNNADSDGVTIVNDDDKGTDDTRINRTTKLSTEEDTEYINWTKILVIIIWKKRREEANT